MPPPDFRLAPPPTPVDGLLAVPIDVQDVTGTVTFDATTVTAHADVTVTYSVGPTAGNPLFDLRQTIGAAWLDGAPLDPAQLAPHDVGTGSFSTVRVLGQVQGAGSVHTLRVTYALATPDSQLGGAYPPVLSWSPGPRLRWTFGMSDLNAGRYLEAWLPSNLIFDRYPVTLDITILGTVANHSVITNGTVTDLGSNHWSVQFPPYFAPLAHLLEIRASDTVESANGSVILPSSDSVAIEAWKLPGGSTNLAAQIATVADLLTANETDYGPFLADRYVVFFHGASGGMEYNGGTTTSTGALAHEVFHSWFARGITPASQADAWWDEGFTTFRDAGADDTEPFDFLAPPVELCSRNPFQRRTPTNSYSAGSRLFRGVASTVGVATLRSAMSGLYEKHRGGPVSTAMLEEHLVSTTGAPTLVDAFHRFVYGLADPAPAPRLWLRDAPGHTGADAWSGEFWNSPDLWIRNQDDGGTTHQSVIGGQDNWFHARVRNAQDGGTCSHFLVTFEVKEFAGTQFTYPSDFLPAVAASAGFDLAPGEERVVSARWPSELVPPAGTHTCLLAAVLARRDHPSAGLHVWEHANLAQKNLAVIALPSGEWLILPIILGGAVEGVRNSVEVRRDPVKAPFDLSLVHTARDFFAARRVSLRPLDLPLPVSQHDQLMDCGGRDPAPDNRVGGILAGWRPQLVAQRFPGAVEHPLKQSDQVGVPVEPPQGGTVVGLKIAAPPKTAAGQTLRLDLVHRAGKRIVGGVAVEVRTLSTD